MVRVMTDRSGRVGIRIFADRWGEFWSGYGGERGLLFIKRCNAAASQRTCELVGANGVTGTLQYSLTDGTGSLQFMFRDRTSAIPLAPVAPVRKLRTLFD